VSLYSRTVLDSLTWNKNCDQCLFIAYPYEWLIPLYYQILDLYLSSSWTQPISSRSSIVRPFRELRREEFCKNYLDLLLCPRGMLISIITYPICVWFISSLWWSVIEFENMSNLYFFQIAGMFVVTQINIFFPNSRHVCSHTN
jgi:hypothetical protein